MIPEAEYLCFKRGCHDYVVCAYTYMGAVLAIFFACQDCGTMDGY